MPVRVAVREPTAAEPFLSADARQATDIIEIVLPDGSQVRVGNAVSGAQWEGLARPTLMIASGESGAADPGE